MIQSLKDFLAGNDHYFHSGVECGGLGGHLQFEAHFYDIKQFSVIFNALSFLLFHV